MSVRTAIKSPHRVGQQKTRPAFGGHSRAGACNELCRLGCGRRAQGRAGELQYDRPVHETVDHGSRHHVVLEHLVPLGKHQVGGDHDAAGLLVPVCEELEQDVHRNQRQHLHGCRPEDGDRVRNRPALLRSQLLQYGRACARLKTTNRRAAVHPGFKGSVADHAAVLTDTLHELLVLGFCNHYRTHAGSQNPDAHTGQRQ